jgi:hypothetical protein
MKSLTHLLTSMTIVAIASVWASTNSRAQPNTVPSWNLYLITSSGTTLLTSYTDEAAYKFDSHAACLKAAASLSDPTKSTITYLNNPPMYATLVCIQLTGWTTP